MQFVMNRKLYLDTGNRKQFHINSSFNHVFIDRFKTLRELKEKEQQETLLQLQNGLVSLSPKEEEEEHQSIMGLDLSKWEDRSYEQRERSLQVLGSHESTVKEEREARDHARLQEISSKSPTEAQASTAMSTVVAQERARTAEEPGQKTTRAKRESRRMRELEQAKFSLELLKVRATSGGASSPSEERRWSIELVPPVTPPLRSPQGTPDSQSSKGSFELLNLDEEPPKATEEVIDIDDTCSPPPSVASVPEPNVMVVSASSEPLEPRTAGVSDAVAHPGNQDQMKINLAAPSAPMHPPKINNYLPTFYVPANEGSIVISRRPAEEPQQNTEAAASTSSSSITRPFKERRESTHRPVVVVISMQKETPLTDIPSIKIRDSAAQTGELIPLPQKPDQTPVPQSPIAVSVPQADETLMEKLVRLNEEKEVRQRNQQQQNEKEMMEQIRQQKEVLEQQRRFFVQYERDMFEKKREQALHTIQQSRQSDNDVSGAATCKPVRPSSLLIERTAGLIPHARTQSDSHAPSVAPGVDIQGIPPPPASASRESQKESRPVAEGWAPKLILESRDGGGTRMRTAAKQPPSSQGTTVSMTDKSGNIFFSPKDKVTFAK